jgi:hypothetical protein
MARYSDGHVPAGSYSTGSFQIQWQTFWSHWAPQWPGNGAVVVDAAAALEWACDDCLLHEWLLLLALNELNPTAPCKIETCGKWPYV